MSGVASLAPKTFMPAGWLFEKRTVKPVSIELNVCVATIDIRVYVAGNANIPEVSKQLQSAVKESVQNMTGIVVSRVNLHIAGITFQEKEAV